MLLPRESVSSLSSDRLCEAGVEVVTVHQSHSMDVVVCSITSAKGRK